VTEERWAECVKMMEHLQPNNIPIVTSAEAAPLVPAKP